MYIKNLSLRYRENLPLVLKDLTLHIKPGDHIAFIGRTGSGKSSTGISLFSMYKVEPTS